MNAEFAAPSGSLLFENTKSTFGIASAFENYGVTRRSKAWNFSRTIPCKVWFLWVQFPMPGVFG